MASKSISLLLRLPVDEIPLEIDGEFCLYGAVIKGAMRDWLMYRNSTNLFHKRMAEDARMWMFDTSDENNSFEVFCTIMDIEPDYIRECIRKKAVSMGFGGTDVFP